MANIKIILPAQFNLEQFISTQAHDLRTPFNHITGFSKMLLNTVGIAPLTDLQKEDLGTVYRSGMRALELMNGLIDIARINRHEKEPLPRDTDIEQVIAQGLAHWRKFNSALDVQTDYQVVAKTKTINADEQILRQIVSGVITFVGLYCESITKITISVAEQGDSFLFTFISEGKKARQSPELDRQMFGYIDRTLIELQKGEILQAEETDNGAVIKFSFPKK